MGMFDSFTMPSIEMPDGKFYDDEFQTKDLDGRLTDFRVTSDGRVMRRETDDNDEFVAWRSTKLSAIGVNLRGPIDLRADFYNGRLIRLDITE